MNPQTAHAIVCAARKRGEIIPEPCERCNAPDALAHHEDYSKPLEIMWLCPSCHMQRHRELGRGVAVHRRKPRRKSAVNLSLDLGLTIIATEYVRSNRRYRSFSNYVELLIVRDLRRKGVRLPAEFATV